MRGVYIITSPSGKHYVGKAEDIAKRLSQHRYDAKANPKCLYIARAIRKYGWRRMTVVMVSIPHANLFIAERFFISIYRSNHFRCGYNLTVGGEGAKGYRHRETSRDLMSLARRGQPITEESRQLLQQERAGIAAAYLAGNSLRSIASTYSTSKTRVQNMLRSMGIGLREPDRAGVVSPYRKPGRRLTEDEKAHLRRCKIGKPLYHSPAGKELIKERAKKICIERAQRFRFHGRALRISEIGKLLGISYQAVHYRMKAGKLPLEKIYA